MSIQASVIIAEVARRLNDTNNTSRRWPDLDLLDYLNLAQKMVSDAMPESSMYNGVFELSASHEHTLPATAKGLNTVDYNAGTAGTSKGSVITRIQSAQLDEIDPDWRSMTATDEVDHYYYDSRNPTIFGTYPPNTGDQQVHIVYPVIPTDCATTASNISLRDEDQEALTQATIWYALSDRTEYEDMRRLRAEALEYLKLAINVQAGAEEPAR